MSAKIDTKMKREREKQLYFHYAMGIGLFMDRYALSESR